MNTITDSSLSRTGFPKPPVFFVGRSRELDRLEKHLEDFQIVLLTGFPGMGKTSLASVAARNMADKNQRRIAWVKCVQGSSPGSIMSDILNITSRWNTQTDETGNLLTTDSGINTDDESDMYVINTIRTLNHHKACLFLDDFETVDPKTSARLISLFNEYCGEARIVLISRTMPEGAGEAFPEIFSLHLDFLEPGDCSDLVDAIAEKFAFKPSDIGNLRNIISQAGGHPYFIKKAAGAFISHNYSLIETQGKDFREYIDENFFSSLSPESREFLSILSLARKPLSKAEMLKIRESPGIDDIINQMARAFVLEFYEPCHYAIHNILRDVVSARIEPSLKKDIHGRLGMLFFEEKTGNETTASDANLPEAFHHFVSAGDVEKSIAVFNILIKDYPYRGFFREIISMCDGIISITQGDTALRFLITKGKFISLQGRLEEALDILKNLPDSADADINTTKYRTLSDLCFQNLDRDGAVFYVRKAIHIAAKSGNKVQFALRLCDLANYLLTMHQYKKAKRFADISYRIFTSLGDVYAYPLIPRTEANFFLYNHNIKRAVKILEDLLNEQTLNDDTWQRVIVYYPQLGDYYADLGEFAKAAEYADKSIEIALRYNNAVIECHSLLTKCKILILSGACDDPSDVFDKAQRLSKSRHMLFYNISSLFMKAVFFAKNQRFDEAWEFFDKAIRLAREHNSIYDEAQIRLVMGVYYFLAGNLTACREEMKRILPLFRSVPGEAKIRFHALMILSMADYNSGRLEDFMADCRSLTELAPLVPDIYTGFASLILAITGETQWLDKNLSVEQLNDEMEKTPVNILFDLGCTRSAIRQFKNNMGDFVVAVSRKINFCSRELLSSFIADREKYDLYFNNITDELKEKHHNENITLAGKRNLLNLLAFFMGNAGKVFTAEQIFRLVWEESYEHELNYHSVKVAISRLRYAIEPDPKNPVYIKTHRGGRDSTTWFFDENANFIFVSERKG